MAVVRRRMVVSGRVQGVSFRASCAREARRLGLDGQVCNLGDGRVEVVAQGGEADVGRLLAWCHDGPPGARVERVAVEDLAVVAGGETSFVVVG